MHHVITHDSETERFRRGLMGYQGIAAIRSIPCNVGTMELRELCRMVMQPWMMSRRHHS
jgi:hypothetical protein